MRDIQAVRPLKRGLVKSVIERIQQQISLGILAPGTRLPTETELTQAFGVSRTTIREAVAVLTHSGLLQVRQGDGTYVSDPKLAREDLDARLRRAAALEVYEVRRPLELEAARLAAARRGDADLRRMRELLQQRDRLRAGSDLAGAVAVDVEFHTAIAVATRNAILADLYRAFSAALIDTLKHVARDEALRVDTTDLHHALVDAIELGDAAAAERAAAQIIDADLAIMRRLVAE